MKQNFIFLFCIFIVINSLTGQSYIKMKSIARKPFVAGKFYSSDKDELKAVINDLFLRAEPSMGKDPLAIIVPHAGYYFSGLVAASGFSQVNFNKPINNIFIIGTSHRATFEGAAIYVGGDFETPLGKIPVNIEIAENLINSCNFISAGDDIHKYEHCLEVQLPFLQFKMKNSFNIIPIIIGAQNESSIKAIAEALKTYFVKDNLFVISTDFSHYPSYDDAVIVDKEVADAICLNSPDLLMSTISKLERMPYNNLSTSLCGWSAVYCLLNITMNDTNYSYDKIQYMNSGDISGDHERVVGYWSISLYKTNK